MQEKKFIERIKLYADTGKDANKFFCWTVTGIDKVRANLYWHFSRGCKVRAAWYERINVDTGEVVMNSRLDVAKMEQDYYEDKGQIYSAVPHFIKKNKVSSSFEIKNKISS